MSRLLVKTKPKGVFFRFSGSDPNFAGTISTEISNLTNHTVSELGLVGNICYFDKSKNEKYITSTFEIEKVMEVRRVGVSNIECYPMLEALEGFFYQGDIENYIHDIDKKKGRITFAWHKALLLAYLTDTNLMDGIFRINYAPAVQDKKKLAKISQTPLLIEVKASSKDTYNKGYDESEVMTYFNKLMGEDDED